MAEFTLEEWRKTYSYPEDITQNETVNKYYDTENNTVVNGDKNQGQINLITGNAVGTEDNYYLDPNPLFNTLGQIYSTIVNSGFESARTDAIKMNRDNMDYTNGDNPNTLALKLLMPQYKRRVEVEDLNENFWVISQLLGAAVNALWGPYGLIDVVRRLIAKVTSIENFLGLNDIEKIELLHDGSNDVYFDMYSRFTLSELGLRLKTRGGERIIDNIFTPHNEKSDRKNSSTLAATSRKSLFKAVQTEICNSEKIYDSDIISSRSTSTDDNNYYSLNNVIDALNGRLTSDSSLGWTAYEYTNSDYAEVLKLLDIDSNGTLSVKELQNIEKDVKFDFTTQVLGAEDLKRFSNYKKAYEAFPTIASQVAIKNNTNIDFSYLDYFKKVTVMASTKALEDLDDNADGTVSNDEFLEFGNEQLQLLHNDVKKLYETLNNTITINNISQDDYITLLKNRYIELINNFNFSSELSDNEKYELTRTDGSIETIIFNEEIKFDEVIIDYYGDVYGYSLNSAKAAGLYISGTRFFPNNTIKIYKREGSKQVEIISDFEKYFFDFIGDGEPNLYDIVTYMDSLSLSQKTGYQKVMFIKNIIEEEKQKPGTYICTINGENSLYFMLKQFKASIYEKIKTEGPMVDSGSSEEDWEAIISFFFIHLGTIEESLTSMITAYQPTQALLDALQKMTNPVYTLIEENTSIPEEEKVLASILNTSYELCGNVLIFLYDANYYEFETGDDRAAGLYVKSTDAFYTNANPLLAYSIFDGAVHTYPLFVPRNDLINGEIIQLRLTGEIEADKRNYSRMEINFKNFSKTMGFNGALVDNSTKDNLFLSLYNSFANVPYQYNTKTTLFFKHTTPVKTTGLSSVTQWFQNGIKCQYFRPGETAQGQESIPQVVPTQLTLKASMLAKKDMYEDNSFVSESIVPNIDNTYYNFVREQAYCAATRANLTFYSTAAFDEKGQFIHSPLQLLLSAGIRGDSESIQAKRLIYNYEEGVTALDVMNADKQTCTIEDVKNMLYRNSKETNKPIHIEAIFGGRKVDNYVKKKKIKYIVIEKESGTRHMMYGPTCVGISFSNGFLSTGDGLTSVKEIEHTDAAVEVKWYRKNGTAVEIIENYGNDYIIPADAIYGVVDLTELNLDTSVNNFMIRFYTSNLNKKGTEGEFKTQGVTRRPIFKMAYFFGEDDITSVNE